MKNNDIAVIMSSDLFRGVGEKETESMLGCLSAERRAYEKGAYIYQYGDMVDAIGLVTEGTANVINEDYWGNRNIVAVIEPGETFAESYAGVGIPIGVSVQCQKKNTGHFSEYPEGTDYLFLGLCISYKTDSESDHPSGIQKSADE